MFIVPDDMLEELRCDYCYKYLSVGPVKEENVSKRECGRCALSKPTGVTSVYQHFLENATFKCINRFGGCEDLLTHDEVIAHEKSCNKKTELFLSSPVLVCEYLYKCRRQDPQRYLRKPILNIKLKDINFGSPFIYLKNNYIFFIYVEFETSTRKLSLNAYYIGDEMYEIIQNHTVLINTVMVHEIQQQTCLNLRNMGIYTDWRVNSVELDSHLSPDCNILFQFEFIVPMRVSHQMINNPEMQICLDSKKTHYSVTTIGGINIEIQLRCLLCSNLSYDNIYITSSGKPRQLICRFCIPFVDTNFCLVNNVLKGGVESLYDWNSSCMWNCGTYNKIGDLKHHELNCQIRNQPTIKCPFCFLNGMFEQMKTHLLLSHNSNLFTYLILVDKDCVGHYPDPNCLVLDNSIITFYVWVQPTCIIKCTICRDSHNKFVVITTNFIESVHKKDIIIRMYSASGDKYYKEIMNRFDIISLRNKLPVRLNFFVKPRSRFLFK